MSTALQLIDELQIALLTMVMKPLPSLSNNRNAAQRSVATSEALSPPSDVDNVCILRNQVMNWSSLIRPSAGGDKRRHVISCRLAETSGDA